MGTADDYHSRSVGDMITQDFDSLGLDSTDLATVQGRSKLSFKEVAGCKTLLRVAQAVREKEVKTWEIVLSTPRLIIFSRSDFFKNRNNCDSVVIKDALGSFLPPRLPKGAPLVSPIPAASDFEVSSKASAVFTNLLRPWSIRRQCSVQDEVMNIVKTLLESEANTNGGIDRLISSVNLDLLNDDSDLMKAGLDSTTAALLVQRQRSLFGLSAGELPVTTPFMKSTVREISESIYDTLQESSSAARDKLNPKSLFEAEAEDNFTTDIGGESKVNSKADSSNLQNAEVAITGISCRFPGNVNSLEDFWKLLCDAKIVSEEIPFDRWDAHSVRRNGEQPLSEAVRKAASHGAFVSDMECFDPAFFNISKTEAATMNPQQRVLLETAYLAFVDAGYTLESLKGKKCGVFIGMSQTSGRPSMQAGTVYGATGSAASIAAGRVAYFFDLRGPTAAYDTACSSSLVALDAAVSSLRNGDCEMAIVAGVNELFDPRVSLDYAAAGMLSQSGSCHTWDASADGYLRGEGCGAIILRPIEHSAEHVG